MLAVIGDRVTLGAGGFSGAAGIFVGDRDGLARVALDNEDVVITEPYGHLTIHRPIVDEKDLLQAELVQCKLDALKAQVNAMSVENKSSEAASRALLDLLPLVDLIPVPQPVRDALKNVATDAVQALPF